MKRLEVKTKRLVLRPHKVSDYAIWFHAHVNRKPSQSKWDLKPRTEKECTRVIFKKLMKRHQTLADNDDYYWFGIFEKKTGKLVGHLDFDIYVRSTHQYANFGYRIYNTYWRLGYGQEAARAGLKIGFAQLKLNRLEAAINLDNRKSIRLARSIGMRREVIKKRYWFEYGKWVDHLIYVANPEDIGLRARKPF